MPDWPKKPAYKIVPFLRIENRVLTSFGATGLIQLRRAPKQTKA